MATVRELVTKWGFKVDQKPLTEMENRITKLKSAVAFTAGVATAAGAAIFGLAYHVAKVAGEARKGAISAGISTQAYQELAYAAKITGVEQDGLNTTLFKFNRAIYNARNGGKEMIESLKRAGISTKDLNDKTITTDEYLMMVADRFKTMPDLIQRSALAAELFGRSGKQLIPFLVKGSDGIQHLREEAEKLGLVMSDNDLAKAKKFSLGLKGITAAIEGIRISLGVELFPILTELFTKMKDWIMLNRDMIRDRVGAFIRMMIEVIRSLIIVLDSVIDVVSVLAKAFGGSEKALKLFIKALILFMAMRLLFSIGALVLAIRKLAMAFIFARNMALVTQIQMASLGIAVEGVGVAALIAQAELLVIPLAIGAAIALVILSIEDLIGYFQGKESVTGKLIDAATSIFGPWKKWIDYVLDGIQKIHDFEMKIFSIGSGKFVDLIHKIGTNDPGKINSGMDNANSFIGNSTFNPNSSPLLKNNQSNINMNSPITINVPANTPPDMVGQSVKDGLNDSLGSMFRETVRTNAPTLVF